MIDPTILLHVDTFDYALYKKGFSVNHKKVMTKVVGHRNVGDSFQI